MSELKSIFSPEYQAHLLSVNAKLTKSDRRLLDYLWTIDPFGDREKRLPNPSELAQILGMGISSVYRAMSKLEEHNLWTFKVEQLYGRNPWGSKSKEKPTPKNSSFPKLGIHSQNWEQIPKTGNGFPKLGTDSQNWENEGSESLPSLDFSSSHYSFNTIQDSSSSAQAQNEREEQEFWTEEREEIEQVESIGEILGKEKIGKIEDSQTQTKKEAEGSVDPTEIGEGASSAAAPPRKKFENLRAFILYKVKQDPSVRNAEVFADTCLKRNPTDWQRQWDEYEAQAAAVSTYTPPPAPEIPQTAEERAKVLERIRSLLPAHMRSRDAS